jgi:hypothetical protein
MARMSAASQPGVRSGEAHTLLVDPFEGTGLIAVVRVSLSPGQGIRNERNQLQSDARDGAVAAIGAVLERHRQRTGEDVDFSVRWSVPDQGSLRIAGRSLGLAVAVATEAALRGVPVPTGWAFTGEVDWDGQIHPVDGIDAKQEAAAAGERRLALPAGNGAPDTANLAVSSLDAMFSHLWPPSAVQRVTRALSRRSGRLVLLSSAALFVLFGVLEPAEKRLQYRLLYTLTPPLDAQSVVVVALPLSTEDARRQRRADHGALVARLAAAGAASVTFDMHFTESLPALDAAFAEGIQAAADHAGPDGLPRPVPVTVVVEQGEDNRPIPPGSRALAEAARWGGAMLESPKSRSPQTLNSATIRSAELARVRLRSRYADPDSGAPRDLWHIAVSAVQPVSGPPPRCEGGRFFFRNADLPAEQCLLYLHPVQNIPVLSYDDVLASAPEASLRWLQATPRARTAPEPAGDLIAGRYVVVGAFAPQDLFHIGPHTVDGVIVQAAMIESLAQGRAPRRVPVSTNAALAAGVAAGTHLLTTSLPARRRLLALLVPALTAAAVVAIFSLSRVMVDVIALSIAATAGLLAAHLANKEK